MCGAFPSLVFRTFCLPQALYYVLQHGGPRLSRVHFHSYAYHIVAVREGPGRRAWPRAGASVAAGAVAATLQACNATARGGESALHGNDLDLVAPARFWASTSAGDDDELPYEERTEREFVKLDATKELAGAGAVGTWTRGDVTFHYVPVLVCKEPTGTVGLGDAISAAGLVRHF